MDGSVVDAQGEGRGTYDRLERAVWTGNDDGCVLNDLCKGWSQRSCSLDEERMERDEGWTYLDYDLGTAL
jgi:hypothetical protein